MYNWDKKSGYLYEALVYSKRDRAPQASVPQVNENTEENDEAARNLTDFLTKCILPRDLQVVKDKMKETVALRQKMFRFDPHDETPPKLFSFYRIVPELVRNIFKILHNIPIGI